MSISPMFTLIPPTTAVGTKDGTVSDVILGCGCNVLRLPSGRWRWMISRWCAEFHEVKRGKVAAATEVTTI